MSNSIVHIIDDDINVRESISGLLETIGFMTETFCSVEDFINKQKHQNNGCILLDLRMAKTSGLEFLRDSQKFTSLPIIMMSGYGDIATAVESMKCGAIDFLEKPINPQQLIESVNRGLKINEHGFQQKDRTEVIDSRLKKLSPREKEVLECLLDKQTSKIVARRLGISFRTVEIHRKNILTKLEYRSLSELLKELQGKKYLLPGEKA